MARISSMKAGQQGIALLGAMVLVLILSLLGATLLNLSWQESVGAGAGKAAAVTQQLADAAGELILASFHSPGTAPSTLTSVIEKRNRNAAGATSFFDQAGHSQFKGTAAIPDLLLDAKNAADDRLLNDPQSGLFHGMHHLGTIQELKVYAPSRPGLLCTVDVTVATQSNPSVRQSVTMQLSALDVPPLRAAVQVAQSLGSSQPGKESPVSVHWGSLKVDGDLVLRRADDLPNLSVLAPLTGQSYDDTVQREDRWMEAWIGGQIEMTQLSPDQANTPNLPHNVHSRLSPIPGVQLDQWNYDQLKAIAQEHGSYFAIDREGLLYPQGIVHPGHGISPDTIFHSRSVGDQRGLIFIDTLDQTPPRADNLGTVTLRSSYLEGIVVVQGHVVLSPGGPGQSISVLSPPHANQNGTSARTSVQLPQVHVNGAVYATGNVTVTGKARVFGSVTAGGTIASGPGGGTLEVWYNHEYSQGLYRGLPVVFPAPGTWMAKY